jgi:hypothetical protein
MRCIRSRGSWVNREAKVAIGGGVYGPIHILEIRGWMYMVYQDGGAGRLAAPLPSLHLLSLVTPDHATRITEVRSFIVQGGHGTSIEVNPVTGLEITLPFPVVIIVIGRGVQVDRIIRDEILDIITITLGTGYLERLVVVFDDIGKGAGRWGGGGFGGRGVRGHRETLEAGYEIDADQDNIEHQEEPEDQTGHGGHPEGVLGHLGKEHGLYVMGG